MNLFTHTLKQKAKRKTKNSGFTKQLSATMKTFAQGHVRSLGSAMSAIVVSALAGPIIVEQLVKIQAKRLKLHRDTVVNEYVAVRESELHATDDTLLMADNEQMHHIAEHRAAIMQCVLNDVKYRVQVQLQQ